MTNYAINKPENLESLPLPDTTKWIKKEIDKGIVNLVCVLRGIGIDTYASCEGHMNSAEQRPWISFKFASEELKQKLDSIIEHYNKESKIKWVADYSFARLIVSVLKSGISFPTTIEEIEKLQESSEDFAQFIFEKYL